MDIKRNTDDCVHRDRIYAGMILVFPFAELSSSTLGGNFIVLPKDWLAGEVKGS